MPFPEVPRVIYERNPIELVVCELRFPPILRIDAEIPSQFQERVRGIYPFYEPKSIAGLPPGLPPELSRILSQGFPFGGGQRSHGFMDKSRNWTIALSRDCLTLSCRTYERWERFKDFLEPPLAALRELYSPPFYVRIGLRYRDVIHRARLNLNDVGWKDLLNPWIAGPYVSPAIEGEIERTAHQLVIRLSDRRARVLVNHGLVQDQPPGEWSYAIDSDFFDEEPTEDADAINRLDFLNRESGRFFQWCITKRLHEAMGPRPIPNP